MEEIQIYGDKLPIPVTEILSVLQQPLVSKIPDTDLFEVIKTSVAKSYADTGFKLPEARELTYMIDEILNEIRWQFPALRSGEIIIAFSRGVRKKYGDFMGLSVVSFVGFLKGFVQDQDRKDALIAFNLPKDEKEIVSNEEFINKWREEIIKRLTELFNIFCSGGHIQPSEAAHYFKRLYRERIIVLDEDKRMNLKTKAYRIIRDRKDPSNATSLEESRRLKKAYEELVETGTEATPVINEAMNLGLLEWFEELQFSEISIEDALKCD